MFVVKLISMVKTYESRFPPSPNLDKVTVSFDKLINTDLFDGGISHLAVFDNNED